MNNETRKQRDYIVLIDRHNAVVKAIENCDVKISAADLLKMMKISLAISNEAAEIVSQARAAGLNAKYNAQSGEILLYNCGG